MGRTTVKITMDELLERGHPGEILPDELDQVFAAAQWYVTQPSHPDDARQRVMDVWIHGVRRRPFDPREASRPEAAD